MFLGHAFADSKEKFNPSTGFKKTTKMCEVMEGKFSDMGGGLYSCCMYHSCYICDKAGDCYWDEAYSITKPPNKTLVLKKYPLPINLKKGSIKCRSKHGWTKCIFQ